jgi:hypothetical protein
MIMGRIAFITIAVLALAAGAANADPLKDAVRYSHVVTTHGIWDAR